MKPQDFLRSFKQTFEFGLPGEEAHQLLMPLKRPLSSVAKAKTLNYRESAVGIVLHPFNDSINCILIRRPSYEGAHSGQISFPGGKRDLDDIDLEFTARRECREEIALPHEHADLIHPLTEVFIPVSKFSVQPYVFFTDNLPDLTPDDREVEEIISFDIFDLIRHTKIPQTSIPINAGFTMKDVPYFDIHGHIVWGATAMMLAEMKVLLERM
ncbi:MAG: CoA pyrophosphatase [Crocinitomicaceae bacterium]